jgi:hypothetical protein
MAPILAHANCANSGIIGEVYAYTISFCTPDRKTFAILKLCDAVQYMKYV